LISQPNSSVLWIQYIGFYLQSAEIENARGIARMALNNIGFCEEDVIIPEIYYIDESYLIIPFI